MAILEKETFEKFGYYPRDLKAQSKKRIIAICDACKKTREIKRADYSNFCFSCARKGERSGKWKGGKVKRICMYCGKVFEAKPFDIKNGRGKFCSRDCWGKWQSEHLIGEKSHRWKGGKIEQICKVCYKHFFVFPRTVKRGQGLYCSYSCARKDKKIPTHHTKPELIFEEICKKNNLPFKYTGDGSFWIGNINPDFVEINGKKIAIEIFSYWHNPLKRHCKVRYSATYEGRKNILKKHKWKLVIFWQEDIERRDAEAFILNALSIYNKK